MYIRTRMSFLHAYIVIQWHTISYFQKLPDSALHTNATKCHSPNALLCHLRNDNKKEVKNYFIFCLLLQIYWKPTHSSNPCASQDDHPFVVPMQHFSTLLCTSCQACIHRPPAAECHFKESPEHHENIVSTIWFDAQWTERLPRLSHQQWLVSVAESVCASIQIIGPPPSLLYG